MPLWAQVEWEEMDPHNSEIVELQYVTSQGDLIGSFEFPPRLVVSKNNGDSWETFYQGDLLLDIPFGGLIIKEWQNSLYLAFENIVYQYDESTKVLEEYIEFGDQRDNICLLYTSPSPRDQRGSRMPSSA